MLLTFNLVYATLSGPAGALSDRIGRSRLIIGGWTAYGVLYLGFALAADAWQIWLLYALYGLYYGATEGTAKALVADLVGAEQRGTAYGVYNAAVGIMALPASVIAGVLWQGALRLGWIRSQRAVFVRGGDGAGRAGDFYEYPGGARNKFLEAEQPKKQAKTHDSPFRIGK